MRGGEHCGGEKVGVRTMLGVRGVHWREVSAGRGGGV
jgi:hypothetical protein